ncbi:hypothetical protein DICVIV_02989 [Dictyocaulus viviparus]|uniref:Uncharacterized protein n=1 Tax=Dictyocaulus viviparus TaxID=29172 RepID=A0A0D8Y4B4_DICVI|nr:hypothetical protein DICVIV_02989 [Dictyocaulus viviparus]
MVTSLEVVLAKGGNEIIAFICNLVYILPFYNRFLGLVIEIHSICRDYKHHRLPTVIVGTTTLCVCGYLLTTFACYKPITKYYRHLSSFFQSSTELMLMAATVVIFFHLYGKREYFMDLCDLYPEDGQYSKLTNPLSSIQFFVYDVIPFLFCFLTLYEISGVLKGGTLSKLFLITPQHPSYNRVNYIELFETNDQIVADTSRLPTMIKKYGDTASTKTAPTMDETEVQRFGSAEQTTTGTKSTDKGSAERISSKAEGREIKATSSVRRQTDESKRRVKKDREGEFKAMLGTTIKNYNIDDKALVPTTHERKPKKNTS